MWSGVATLVVAVLNGIASMVQLWLVTKENIGSGDVSLPLLFTIQIVLVLILWLSFPFTKLLGFFLSLYVLIQFFLLMIFNTTFWTAM